MLSRSETVRPWEMSGRGRPSHSGSGKVGPRKARWGFRKERGWGWAWAVGIEVEPGEWVQERFCR